MLLKRQMEDFGNFEVMKIEGFQKWWENEGI
jgi:hypothetical protein